MYAYVGAVKSKLKWADGKLLKTTVDEEVRGIEGEREERDYFS